MGRGADTCKFSAQACFETISSDALTFAPLPLDSAMPVSRFRLVASASSLVSLESSRRSYDILPLPALKQPAFSLQTLNGGYLTGVHVAGFSQPSNSHKSPPFCWCLDAGIAGAPEDPNFRVAMRRLPRPPQACTVRLPAPSREARLPCQERCRSLYPCVRNPS